ncbi:MAG: Cold shock protein of CSP family [uncultured Rubrobacteraceae bacterium]|uniref:Cold shock protein of CSP family n=1 Tax=uncultured Rubrobacteraceae bacterium TaxID=349277 RepID=A0A6J4RD10_9ACTN|nr:MAG: Cold shock protein of CSP family [uncultured Rubrobacteraceae bacterium]
MPHGTVKWFDGGKGYGFISPDEGDGDLFVHHSSILGGDFKSLEEGEEVSFEIGTGKKGPQAESVRRLSPPQAPPRSPAPRAAPTRGPGPSSSPDVPDLLRMLVALRDADVLTPEEFRAKRDDLVERL